MANRTTRVVALSVITGLSGVAGRAAADAPLRDTQYLRDYAETRGFTLGRPSRPLPTPQGDAVLFLRAPSRTPRLELYEFDVRSGESRLLLTPEDILKGAQEHLSAEEKALRERMRVSVGGFTEFQLSKDGQKILLSLSGKIYVVQRQSRAVQELKTGPGSIVDAKFSPDAKNVAYVLDHDVYAYDLASDREHRVTSGGTEAIAHGLAEFVAREEMARYSGYWWAPDSRAIAYQENDASDVETWYVADPAKPGDPPYPVRYPRPGKSNVTVRLGVAPIDGGTTTWINWDRARYSYLTSVHWDEHGPLTIGVETRDQTEFVLLSADLAAGKTTVLLTERDSAWVDLRQDVPQWLPRNQGFLWASQAANSSWQLEWRQPSGRLQRVIVPPNVGFRTLTHVNPVTGEVAFTARPDPTQWKQYRASLDGSEFVELTREPGCHDGQVDDHHTIYVDSFSSLANLPQTIVYRRDGTPIGELPSVAESSPLIPKAEIVKLGAGAGFYAALVRPRDFDPAKRYPVIVQVYGGPHYPWASGTVVASMRTWLLPQWIANQGFVVVSLDGRGTPGRGHDWERSIFKQLGSVPLADQVAGLKALGEKYRELDLDRVGIYGWSFGGYMSALAVLKEPGLYKAAVAGAPVTDFYDYDTHYTERYLGIPPADAPAYEQSSLLPLAPNLERPLLLIHGTSDDNVYFRHTLKLVDTLFRAGRTCEVLPLSGLTHMVPDPIVNEQLYSRLVRHFIEHLAPVQP